MLPKLGILAGGGELPVRLIGACQDAGRPYFVIAFDGQTPKQTVTGQPHVWVRLGAAGKTLEHLRQEGVQQLVFAGDIKRPSLGQLRPDWWAIKFLSKSKVYNAGDDGLLSALVSTLEKEEGFGVVGIHEILVDTLVGPGFVSSTHSDLSKYHEDIRMAITAALSLGAEDKGQAAVARNLTTVELEDETGTDAMLARLKIHQVSSKTLALSGVLAKMSKLGQEVRVDLPTIGPGTVHGVINAGLAGIVIEAGKSLVVDEKLVKQSADQAGVFVLAVDIRGGVDELQLP